MPTAALSSEEKQTSSSTSLSLSEMQAAFQSAVMSGDDVVLNEILDSSRTNRQVLFGVYRHAYVARLIEVVGNDHPLVRRFLGDEAFQGLAGKYVAEYPSQNQNARWFSHRFPDFLTKERPTEPHLAELAELERALNDAFDAPDAEPLALSDLATIPPDHWSEVQFQPHPSARRLAFRSNAHALWLALKNDETPPQVETLREPQNLLIWRHDTMPKVRRISGEEAMMWAEAVNGVSFGGLCELVAVYDDAETAPLRAAGYLHGWIASGTLARGAFEALPED